MIVDQDSKQRSIPCDTLCELRSAHEEIDVTSRRSSCDEAMLHATARCMCSINIVVRIYEDEIHKRINYVLHERADMQMECSEDAIRIE